MKKFRIEIKWGMLFTIATLLWVVLEKTLGWHGVLIAKHAVYTNFFAFIAIAIFVFALIEKRTKDLGGKMTWVQGFVSGIIVSVVVAMLSPFSQYITHEFITPDYFNNAITYAVKNNVMTQENAEAYFNIGSYRIQAAFGALGSGIVTAAMVSLFIRKK